MPRTLRRTLISTRCTAARISRNCSTISKRTLRSLRGNDQGQITAPCPAGSDSRRKGFFNTSFLWRRETVAQSEFQQVGAAVIAGAEVAFRANKGWADKAVAQLSDEKLHVALDVNTNSIAVIMKHVGGKLLSRWADFLTTDGEKPWRNRDEEFVDTFANRSELLEHWERGWNSLFQTLDSLTPSDLAKSVLIRGEPHSVPLAIHRSLAHCGYHVGQIILIARVLAGDNWQ